MKNILFILGVVLVINGYVYSQNAIKTSANVSLMGGPGIHNFTNLEAHLKQPEVMGRDVNFTSVGIETGGYVGGKVRGVFLRRLMAGLSVHGLFFPQKSSDRADLAMKQRGGHVNVGYIFFNNFLLQTTIYGGVGYDNMNFKLTNKSNKAINFFPDEPITPGNSESYVLEGVSYELGLSVKRYYPFDKDQSNGFGVIFGADLGGRLMGDPDGWNTDHPDGPPYDTQLGAYLRLTLGVAYYEKE